MEEHRHEFGDDATGHSLMREVTIAVACRENPFVPALVLCSAAWSTRNGSTSSPSSIRSTGTLRYPLLVSVPRDRSWPTIWFKPRSKPTSTLCSTAEGKKTPAFHLQNAMDTSSHGGQYRTGHTSGPALEMMTLHVRRSAVVTWIQNAENGAGRYIELSAKLQPNQPAHALRGLNERIVHLLR